MKTNRSSTYAKMPVRTALAVILTAWSVSFAFSQATGYPEYGLYDTDLLPPSFFKANREKLLRAIGDSALAVFYSAPEHTRINDTEFKYRQDNDFFYLTGCNQPNSLLLLSSRPFEVSDTSGKHSVREILFVEERNPARETWTGRQLGPYGAITVLGFESALPNSVIEKTLGKIIPNTKEAYFPLEPSQAEGKLAEFVRTVENYERLLQHWGRVGIRNPVPLVRQMREVKSPEELRLIRRAVDISMDGHRQMLKSCKPGMYEYQLQALFEYVTVSQGAEYMAYPCIVGSNENSVILHYESNRRRLGAGEVIVADCGAEYHNYASDITRTIPVGGKFTAPQRQIYDIVLSAQEKSMDLMKPGVNYYAIVNKKAIDVVRDGLLKLGIIKDSADYRKYFMHGVGHPVGLDVHDVSLTGVLKAGEVWTVEPGIYIPAHSEGVDPKYWNIGVRLEDDVLVTENGYELLTKDLPRDPDAVERLMKEPGIGALPVK
ncbi:MAG: M24 family metallopeptidase [Ignavibacteria bacterium]|nr:MAG: M24 family metallopeptidase [Ignavibacteria bacterium]